MLCVEICSHFGGSMMERECRASDLHQGAELKSFGFPGLAIWSCVNQHPSSSELRGFDHVQNSVRRLLLGGTEELCEYRAICGKIFLCTEVTWQSFAGAWAPFWYRFLKIFSFTKHFKKLPYLDSKSYLVDKSMFLWIMQDKLFECRNFMYGCLKQLSNFFIAFKHFHCLLILE